MAITITPSASTQVRRMMDENELVEHVVRIGVTAGGCSGYSYVLDIVDLTIRETNVVPFVETAPDGRQCVRARKEEKLRHVEDVEELGAVADIEPHPVTV